MTLQGPEEPSGILTRKTADNDDDDDNDFDDDDDDNILRKPILKKYKTKRTRKSRGEEIYFRSREKKEINLFYRSFLY